MLAKRLILLMMVLVMAFAVTGCGGSDAINEDPTDLDVPPVTNTDPDPVIENPTNDTPVDTKPMKAELTDVFFAFDSYSLTTEGRSTLQGNADALKQFPDSRVVIEGHCDERGTKSYNLALGEKRAQAAKDYLVRLGVSGNRITVISYGKEKPFAMGSNESAWAKNRRAHMVVK